MPVPTGETRKTAMASASPASRFNDQFFFDEGKYMTSANSAKERIGRKVRSKHALRDERDERDERTASERNPGLVQAER
jgi:hypothetical protein